MLTRLAPTPSGYLHPGNAFSFLLTEQYAKQAKGGILLRIDDMDTGRKRPEYVKDIFDSLEWLGIEWQLGPKDPDDFEANWSQQHRLALYENAIQRLQEDQKIYACTCSRKTLQKNNTRCSCESKQIPFGTPDTALRLSVKENTLVHFSDGLHQQVNLYDTIGPFTIRRRDGIPSYQLASLCDDLHFKVTDIIRGKDLLNSTAAQIFLAAQLGEKIYSRFVHHPLVTDEKGQKLSKSESALSLKAMRENGMTATEVRSRFHEWQDVNGLKPA